MNLTKYSKVRKLLTTDQGIGVYVGEEELVCCHHGAFTLQTVEPAGRREVSLDLAGGLTWSDLSHLSPGREEKHPEKQVMASWGPAASWGGQRGHRGQLTGSASLTDSESTELLGKCTGTLEHWNIGTNNQNSIKQ